MLERLMETCALGFELRHRNGSIGQRDEAQSVCRVLFHKLLDARNVPASGSNGFPPSADRAKPNPAAPEVPDLVSAGIWVEDERGAVAAFLHALHPLGDPRIDLEALRNGK